MTFMKTAYACMVCWSCTIVSLSSFTDVLFLYATNTYMKKIYKSVHYQQLDTVTIYIQKCICTSVIIFVFIQYLSLYHLRLIKWQLLRAMMFFMVSVYLHECSQCKRWGDTENLVPRWHAHLVHWLCWLSILTEDRKYSPCVATF